MSSENLIRWSGLAAVVGGVLLIVSDLLNAALFFILNLLELSLYSVIVGAAVAWMGYGLWSGTAQPSSVAEVAM